MGLWGDFGKVVSGGIDDVAKKTSTKVGAVATRHGAENIDTITNAASRATKYGIYGAAGLGVVGGIYGAAAQDKTMIGGTLGGAGLGTVGGGVAGIAVAIAKGIR